MKQYQTVINEWLKLSGSQTRKGLHQHTPGLIHVVLPSETKHIILI